MIQQIYEKLQKLKGKVNRIMLTADSDETLLVSTQRSNLPALFVYPISLDNAGVEDRPNQTLQSVTHTIGVMIAIPSNELSDKANKKGFDDLIKSIRNELFGWQPQGAFSSISYDGGAIVGNQNKILFFETRWSVIERWEN